MSSTPSDHNASDRPTCTVGSAPVLPPPSLAGDDIPPVYSELPASEPTGNNSYAPGPGTPMAADVNGSNRARPQGYREQSSTTTDSLTAGVRARLLILSQASSQFPNRSVFSPPEQSSDPKTGLPRLDGTPSTAQVPYTSVFGPAEENSDQKTDVRSNGTDSAAPVPYKSVFGPAEQDTDNKATGSQTTISGGLVTSAPMPQPAPTTSAYGWSKGKDSVIEEPGTAHAVGSERKTFWKWFKGWKGWVVYGACCELTCSCLEGCIEFGYCELCGDALEL